MNPNDVDVQKLLYLLTQYSIEREKYERLAHDLTIAIEEIKQQLVAKGEL